MHTRRDFLKFVTAMTGAAGVGEFVPEAVQRAYAINPEPGSTYLDAEHIVILMQENRSFDHAFGTLRGVRGFNDPRALRLANGNSVFVQTDGAGNSYAPWRLDIRDTRITWMGSLPHSRQSQVDAWNQGLHDNWLEAKRAGDKNYAALPLTMGHYTREDLPFYYALADAFTICDQHYCSVMTSTSPNRSYFWSGTIREQQQAAARAHIRNEQIDYGGLTWKTFPERLQAAGIPWKHYQNELTRSVLSGEEEAWLSNYGDNVLESFNAYNVQAYAGFSACAKRWCVELGEEAQKLQARLSAAKDPGQAAGLRRQLEVVQRQIATITVAMENSGPTAYGRLSEAEKALHHAAFVTNAGDPHYRSLDSLPFHAAGQKESLQVPRGDVLYQFRKDVNEGRLPTVSWLTASERFSDHPSSPWYGAWYISEVMNILTSNPEVWKKTIFILTYDENDGYFDHAPSFAAADPARPETGRASAGIDTGLEYIYKEDELRMGVDESDARTGPIGMGFRVPLMIASPWTRGGWVNSQLFDHTSTLMFLERFVEEKYGKTVREENLSAWRRTVAGDLTSAFRPGEPQDSRLNYLQRDPFVVSIAQARYREVPSNYTRLTAPQVEQINRSPQGCECMPRQEPGTRPSCALPYQLYADAGVSSDGRHCLVHLRVGTGSHGAPINLYLRNLHHQAMRAATYTVKTGDTITVEYPLALFTDERYSIEMHGPNGFYRHFTGAGPQPVGLSFEYERSGIHWTGNALLRLRNASGHPTTIEIEDGAYQAQPVSKVIAARQQLSVVLPLERSHGWYDFTVRTRGVDANARYAGRVETGRAGISDPAMGGELHDLTTS